MNILAHRKVYAALLLTTCLFSIPSRAGMPVPGDGGVTITFSDGGGSTNITATGMGFTDNEGARSGVNFLGFLDIGPMPPAVNTFDTTVDPALASLPGTAATMLSDNIAFSWDGTTYIFDSLLIDSSGQDGLVFRTQGLVPINIPGMGAAMIIVDGTGSVPIPFETFMNVYGMSFPSMDGFTFAFLYPVAPSTSAPNSPSKEPTTFLFTNTGSIMSAETTGLGSMDTTLTSVQNAAQNATGDLNNRIFRARGGDSDEDNTVASNGSTSRYLTFAQSQNIDYRVALGLADGEVVEMLDTLSPAAGHPLAMAGVPAVTKAVVVSVDGDGKNPVADKVVVEDFVQTKWTAYTSFDYGYYDQDNLSRTFRGFESDSYAGSAGLEYKLTPWLNLGGAFTYLENDTNLTSNLGSNDLDGQVYSIYTTAFHGNTFLDVLYSYGDFNNDISRNTLLGRTAYGDTESHSHNVAAELGHTIHLNERFSFGPSAGLNYTTGQVDGYTERNGGLANLIYPDHDFESMIGRLGGYATFKTDTPFGLVTSQVSAGWAHEFMPDGGTVTTSLETSPFALVTGNNFRSFGEYTASEERAHAGTDWLELGATTRLDLQNTGFHFELGYQGMFGRNNASGHFGSAKIGYDW